MSTSYPLLEHFVESLASTFTGLAEVLDVPAGLLLAVVLTPVGYVVALAVAVAVAELVIRVRSWYSSRRAPMSSREADAAYLGVVATSPTWDDLTDSGPAPRLVIFGIGLVIIGWALLPHEEAPWGVPVELATVMVIAGTLLPTVGALLRPLISVALTYRNRFCEAGMSGQELHQARNRYRQGSGALRVQCHRPRPSSIRRLRVGGTEALPHLPRGHHGHARPPSRA